MAKYVCDFDTIYSTVKTLKNIVEDYSKGISVCHADIKTAISDWQGKAGQYYASSSDGIMTDLGSAVQELGNLVSFIENATKAIEETETSLSSLTI